MESSLSALDPTQKVGSLVTRVILRPMTVALPDAVIRSLMTNAREISHEWHGEIPLKIHDRSFDRGGTPQWSPDFRRYITARTSPSERNPDSRLRTTRAFRLLRRKAVREFEVVYRIVVLGSGHIDRASLQETATWLNQRCERNGLPDRYTPNDVLIMLHSGLDKVIKWL